MAKKKVRHIPPAEKTLDYVRFGDAVRELIVAKGYYLSTVAEAVELSAPYFGELLRGKKHMQLDTYFKVLNVLEVSDILLVTDYVSQRRITECAPLICELLSLVNDMPEDVLRTFVSLAKQTVGRGQLSDASRSNS